MNKKRKKLTSVFLVFCLVALSGSLMGKERKGVKLAIQNIDGQQVNGELITVKPDSLLLLDSETGSDVSVNIEDIKAIKIVKKSLAYELGLGGFLATAAYRGVAHSSIRREEEGEAATQHFLGTTLVIGAIAGVAGVIIGIVLGMDKTIKIEGKSDVEIDAALKKLSKKARVPNYQ